MKKIIFSLIMVGCFIATSFGQRYISKNGHVWFYSDAPLEIIEAHNNQANAALDIETGDFVFKILMKSFIFEKALMQEHFNENYVESDKYPASTFKGKVTNIADLNLKEKGTYDAHVEGELTIHGITKKVSTDGTLKVSDDDIHAKASFNILIADYNISIPGAVAGKIAEEVQINVDVNMKELKN